ncbi:MAG: amidohydrolase family protein [Phycisphaerales bacterium]
MGRTIANRQSEYAVHRVLSTIILALVPLTTLTLSAAAQAPASTAVLFRNVRVFDGKADALIDSMNVLVEGNKIAKISKDAIYADGATVIDGKGRTLMPGLIDNHSHIFMSANTQFDMISPRSKPEDLHANAAKEAEAMLLRGFTTVRDLGGPVFDLKKSIDEGKAIGPRIYPSGAMISQTSGHGDSREPNERSRRFGGVISRGEMLGISFIADGRDEVLTATRENLRGGATQIKVMAGGGAASAYDPLDVAQYTLDELKAAVEAADDWGTYVTVHAYTPKAVNRAIEAGVKCIEHGQLLDEATIKVLAAKGIFLSLQCLDEAPATAPEDVQAKKRSVVAGTDNAFKWAKQYGVKLAWGTDFLFNPAQNKNQNADILKLKAWFTPAQALKLVTHDNAQLLALCGLRNPYPGTLGVVEVGALADLLLVGGDPLADLSLVSQPEAKIVVIMKDGKIYKDIATK